MGYLRHSGTPHEGPIPHSGRYPWGSGENPNQRPATFYEHVKAMRQQGLSDKEIADGMGMTIRELKARYSVAWTENRQGHVAEAHRLLEQR